MAGVHDCDEALRHLWEYVDAELAAPDCDQLRAHLDGCSGCLDEYTRELVMKNLVRRCCHETAPSTLRVRITQQLEVLRVQASSSGA